MGSEVSIPEMPKTGDVRSHPRQLEDPGKPEHLKPEAMLAPMPDILNPCLGFRV